MGGLTLLKSGKDCSKVVSDQRGDLNLPLDLLEKGLSLLGKRIITLGDDSEAENENR
jgi:hypothetical protein